MKFSTGHRQIGAQFIVAVGVCGAAYYFLVQPAKRDLAETRTKVSALLTSLGAASATGAKITEDQIKSIQTETRSRAELIQQRSGPARNEAELFAAVSDLAKKHSIRVNQLQPTAILARTRPTGPGATPAPAVVAPPAEPGAPLPKDSSVGYTLSVLGSYANLTAFMDALSRDLGFTVITGGKFQIARDGTGDLLQAEIRTEHFAFDASQILGPAGPTTPAQTAAHGPEHAP